MELELKWRAMKGVEFYGAGLERLGSGLRMLVCAAHFHCLGEFKIEWKINGEARH